MAELFANAASCLFDTMLDRHQVRPAQTRTVELSSPNLDELFLDWLRELLFFFSAKSFAVSRAEITSISENDPCRLAARLSGESYEPERHGLKIEIKTPTYHEYRLEPTPDGYSATVVLDV